MPEVSSSTSGMTRAFTIIETSGVAAAERMMAAERAARPEVLPAVQASTIDSSGVIGGNGGMFEWFGGGQAAGVNVTPETAMRMAAVWRCVTLIAGAMMCMPLAVYKRAENGGKVRQDEHPFTRFLRDETNDHTSAPEFIELQAMAVLLRGNGYGLPRVARNGVLTDIDYYHPAAVTPFRSGRAVWYRFYNIEDGTTEDHHSSEVLHFKGPGLTFDRLRALSPIQYHAQTIGVGLATRDYTAGQFERGLMTNDFFAFPKDVTPTEQQRADFKEYLRKRAQGVRNAHNPLVLENGAEWKRVAVTAKDAQLLELLQYTAIDVARIFGVPPHMIGETDKSTSWGSGIEQLSLGFVRYTVMPHVVRFAKELSRKLFPTVGAKVSPYFIDFDQDAISTGDSKSDGEAIRIALGGNQLPGYMSIDEVRRKKGLPPLPNGKGEEVYVPTGEPAVPGQPPVDPEPIEPKKGPDHES